MRTTVHGLCNLDGYHINGSAVTVHPEDVRVSGRLCWSHCSQIDGSDFCGLETRRVLRTRNNVTVPWPDSEETLTSAC